MTKVEELIFNMTQASEANEYDYESYYRFEGYMLALFELGIISKDRFNDLISEQTFKTRMWE